MAAAIPTAKLLELLDDLLTNAAALQGTLHLYNDPALNPAITDTAAAYIAAECAFTGYAAVDLASATFPAASADGSNDAQSVHATITFTQTGTGATDNVAGYYILDSGGNLVRAKLDPAGPVAMDTLGNTYSVDLTVKLKRA